MTRKFLRIFTIVIFIVCIPGIAALILLPSPWEAKKSRTEQQARVVIPRSLLTNTEDIDSSAEYMAREDSLYSKVPLEDGEVLVTVLSGLFDGGPVEKQFVAYRNLLEVDSPIYVTFIDYNEVNRSYERIWSAKTAATRPGTVSLSTQDLIGDKSLCLLLAGMNAQGQHTLTIFRKTPTPQSAGREAAEVELFRKIAEFSIEGTITVKETERGIAYQSGQSNGASFTISAFGRDFDSSNILDQVEITYAYNQTSGVYEQTKASRIPGSQVEQRRVRELLGSRQVFEEFITGLWYFVTPQGKINKNQYIYFSPSSQEIIFYGDEILQVFNWTNSIATRYGLYVASQNISVTTLKRTIDIELESLESIRIRVQEDVSLRIGVNNTWDGSYCKAPPPEKRTALPPINAHLEASYDGPMGKIHFLANGSYELTNGSNFRQGKYAFFYFNDKQELLELSSESSGSQDREIYLVEGENTESQPRKSLILSRIRLGSNGIEKLHERAITLTLASE
jgi:hypothetical protein